MNHNALVGHKETAGQDMLALHDLPPSEGSPHNVHPDETAQRFSTEQHTVRKRILSPFRVIVNTLRRRREDPAQVQTAVLSESESTMAKPQAPVAEAEQERQAEPLSDEAERFWGEEGYAFRPSTFAEQVARARGNKNAYSTELMAKPSEIFGRLGHRGNRTRFRFTERDGLLDLDEFLTTVQHYVDEDNSPEAEPVREELAFFKEHLTFLDSEEYEAATAGLARMWAEYVRQGPDHVLNLFDPALEGSYQKSYTVVLRDVHKKFLAEVAGTDLDARVHLDAAEWQDTENARLVVLDDWTTAGYTMGKLVARAASRARNHHLEGLSQKIEAHLLIARAGQSRQTLPGDGTPYTVRAFYEAEGAYSSRLVPLSGAHSSVDTGFEMPLDRFQKYLQKKGYERETPLLAHLQRAYQAEAIMGDERMAAVLEEMAGHNRVLTELNNREHKLRMEMNIPGHKVNVDALHEIITSQRQLAASMRELRSRYDALLATELPSKSSH